MFQNANVSPATQTQPHNLASNNLHHNHQLKQNINTHQPTNHLNLYNQYQQHTNNKRNQQQSSPSSLAHDFSLNQQDQQQQLFNHKINNSSSISAKHSATASNKMLATTTSTSKRNKQDDHQRQQLLQALLLSSSANSNIVNDPNLTQQLAYFNTPNNNSINTNTSLMTAPKIDPLSIPSSTNDASYLWKQYELAAALCQLVTQGGATLNNNTNINSTTIPNLNSLGLLLSLISNQELSLNLSNTQNFHTFNFPNGQDSPLDSQQLPNQPIDDSMFNNQLSPNTPSPFKVQQQQPQQPTAPSSTLLAKLHIVTSRQNAHILSTELDHKIIDLLEALYPINDNPDSAAIEMIARRTNVLSGLISNWFDDKRRLLNPNAGPKSPPAKKRAGGRVVTFSEYQRSLLEAIFDENNYLHPQEYEELSNLIQVPSRNIKIWFKNRRSKKRLSGRIIP